MSYPSPPVALSCNSLTNPLAIGAQTPVFAWKIVDPRRGACQTGWHVVVRDANTENVVWDSGEVMNDQQSFIAYQGPALTSNQSYQWTVRYCDQNDMWSEWAKTQRFATGLCREEDWQAKWIAQPIVDDSKKLGFGKLIWAADHGPDLIQRVFFRKNFDLPAWQKVGVASVQVAANHSFVLYLNGELVGGNDGGRVIEFDIKRYLQTGSNRLAVEARKLLPETGLQLAMEITMENGEVIQIASDESWVCHVHEEFDRNNMPSMFTENPKPSRVSNPDDPWIHEVTVPQTWPKTVLLDSSTPSFFETWPLVVGPLKPSPFFRKEFEINKGVKQATIHVCGLGYSDVFTNGQKVSDGCLNPAQSNYEKITYYLSYDVTRELNPGANCVGVVLGDGFFNQQAVWGGMSYGQPCLIFHLDIRFDDGSQQRIVSDSSWRVTSDGPIRRSNVYAGEYYDARKELTGWASPGFADQDWTNASEIASPTQSLVPQDIPPVRPQAPIPAVSSYQAGDNCWVFDIGQNIGGVAKIKVSASPGTRISLRMAEKIQPNGAIDLISTGFHHTHIFQTQEYICSGQGVEIWQPSFVYLGFQYVEMRCFDGEIQEFDIWGVPLHTDLKPAGDFLTSDPTLNRYHTMTRWTQLDNTQSVPTDCPQREKCGWLGDAHIAGEMVIYNFQVLNFYRKYLEDIITSLVDGLPTMIAPGKRACGMATVDWGTAMVQVPWYLYLYYGDRRPLERIYPYWQRWFEHLEKLRGDGFILHEETPGVGLGDWCPPGGIPARDTSVTLTSTIYYYVDAWIASKTASLLGFQEDAAQYQELAEKIKQAFEQTFMTGSREKLATQTAKSISLGFDLIPSEQRSQLAAQLAAQVADDEYHLHAGIMGHRFLYQELAEAGYEAEAFKMLKKKTWPSMGYTLELGATTLWEIFCLEDGPNEFQEYSLNHPMQGGFDTWFFNGILGIRPDLSAPGFKKIVFHPTFTTQLRYARGWHESPYGTISSNWYHLNGEFHWEIVVPPNSSALVYLPNPNHGEVREGGQKIEDVQTIGAPHYSGDFCILKISAGKYHFVV